MTNLFLCPFVVPFPIVSTSRTIECRKIKQLGKAGAQATRGQSGDLNEELIEVTEEELYKASDEAIELSNEETFKKFSASVRDSSDKFNFDSRDQEIVQDNWPEIRLIRSMGED